ncbi:glycosyltransferase [Parvularcula marina]|uniref:glycosyltransferase n=1 Tax=Parvularcula marina TaxID=2292771 RepID=UPI0035189B8E
MTITIFMPVLNGASFIAEAIASIEAQTSPDWRLCVLDGGSADGTVDIASARCEADSRITVKSAPDDGQYPALLNGILSTNCDHVGWLNADDLMPPWAVAEASRAFAETGADWISGLPSLWDSEGRLRAVYPLARRSRRLIRAGWYHDGLLGCLQQESMFFRKRLIEGLTAAERDEVTGHRLAGDFALWRSFARQTKLVAVPVVLGGFRRHGQNRSLLAGQAYADEVREMGGKDFPGFVARKIRSVHDYLAAIGSLKAARKSAEMLAREGE